jgi:type IV secretion system protein VirB10
MSHDISKADAASQPGQGANTLEPLPGEPGIPSVAQRSPVQASKKGLLALALFVLSLIAVSAFAVQRFVTSGTKPDDGASKRAGDRPAIASIGPKKLDMTPAPSLRAASAVSPLRIPAILPTDEELAQPIGVRRTGQPAAAPAAVTPKVVAPEDAASMLVTSRPSAAATKPRPSQHYHADPGEPADPLDQTRRNLEAYQAQLQGLLDTLTKTTSAATQPSGSAAPAGTSPPSVFLPPQGGAAPGGTQTGGLFGGQLQGSATAGVGARMLGDRSLTLPKGTAFTCALKTKIVSAASGLVGCQVQRNVYGEDGRVLLVERGSHMDGEYRITSVRPGTVRIPVIWTRIRTPNGVTVNIDSPGTGPLGESGVDGFVDNRWGDRIGAALLLSLIQDSVQFAIQHESNAPEGNTVILPSTTSTGSKLAEKVLDSTINIPPLIYQNQGGIVGIYVARDVDFSSVYELRPTAK